MKDSVRRPGQNITQLLVKWGAGDKAALDELIPRVYDELRKLAANYLLRAWCSHPSSHRFGSRSVCALGRPVEYLDGTSRAIFWSGGESDERYFADQARKRLATKRGGDQLPLSLSQAERFGHKPEVEIVALDDALELLAATNPQHSRVIELRFFGGLTIAETAEVMNLSQATTECYWSFARAWLRRELAK